MFDTEARILDALGQQHDQIPTLFAYCQESDETYQVQEYIDGENLGGWIARKRRLSAQGAIELLLDLLPVVDYIHSHGVIHRDIKPSNLIQRRSDGKVVLIDFGAAYHDSSQEAEAETALEIGTPGYMPDEQQRGHASFSSDLYALGLSVINLLTGIAPSKLEFDEITGTLDWQSHLRESLDPRLIAILDRMTQQQQRDRFARAADVLTALSVFPGVGKTHKRRWSVSLWQQSAAQARQVLKPALALSLVMFAGGWYFVDRGHSVNVLFAHVNGLMRRSDMQLTLLRNLPMQSAIDQMRIAPNNRVLVTAGADHVLRLWSLPNGAMLKALSGHRDRVTALSITADSRFLISSSEDRTVRLWDMNSGELLREFTGALAAVTAIAISPDGQTIAGGSKDGTLRLWNLQTGALLRTLTIPDVEVTAVVFGKTSVITASHDRTTQSNVRQLQVWDLANGQLRRTLTGHTEPIVNLQMVNDHMLLSVGTDRSLLWDLDRDELVRVFDQEAPPVTAFLDGQRLMTVYGNGSIQVRTQETGWLSTTIAGKWRNLQATLSPNQRYLACWSPDQQLRIWQVAAAAQ
ncbi:MAG: protein kinase [Microcoleus sp. SIO2G3]|nr:protein kinase [Microcoleus sp. SIO2G3]